MRPGCGPVNACDACYDLPPSGLRPPCPVNIHFRSYCSSSDGNCLALWTGDCGILIDCGVKTLRDTRTLLRGHRETHGPLEAVLVSHSHGDHLSHNALRVLEEEGVEVRGHRAVVSQLRIRHEAAARRSSPIQPLAGDEVTIGDFRVAPIPLSHAPNVPTFGFVIHAGHGTQQRKIVVCTDFYDPADVLPHLPGADFVFVEANHDVELLRQYFNPNSRFHLNNAKTARLLADAFRRGARPPRHAVLGHLSAKRNRDHLAVREVERAFTDQQVTLRFTLETAPRYHPSRVMTIA